MCKCWTPINSNSSTWSNSTRHETLQFKVVSSLYLTASGNGAFELEQRLQTQKQTLRKQGQDARRGVNGVIAVFEAHVIAAFMTVA